MASQWHFDPDSYLEMVRSEIPSYDRMQGLVAEASRAAAPVTRILDLGSGTGVTAASVLAEHAGATLVGLDASEQMLRHARELVPEGEFFVGELDGDLPSGDFDLVVSAFAVHHLDAAGKAALFERIAAALAPGGRFVMCDVVTPIGDVEHPVPLEDGVDLPSSVDEQLSWLRSAGLRPEVVFAEGDLAVIAADRTRGPGSGPAASAGLVEHPTGRDRDVRVDTGATRADTNRDGRVDAGRGARLRRGAGDDPGWDGETRQMLDIGLEAGREKRVHR